jgi:hypothetical protein
MSDYAPPPPPGDQPPPPPPPPPGGYGAPAPGPSDGPGLDVGAAISYGWNGFTRNVGPLLLITLIVVVLSIGLSVVGQFAFGDSFVLSLAWNIVTTVVSLIVAMGLIRAALAVVDGRTPEVGMLFQGEGLVPYLVASLLVGISVGIGILLCIIPGLILAFLFAFYGYAIVDGRTGDGIEAMKISWQLVSSNVGSLILLFLLVLAINFAGALLCGIGLFVTYPLTAIAIAYAWRRMTGGHVAAQV